MKMNQPLNGRQKGKLRIKKLRELSKNGRLQFIRTRSDLAEAIGFPYDQKMNAGYQWVLARIRKGVLKETITGYTEDGHAEYEYQFIDPDKKPHKKPATATITVPRPTDFEIVREPSETEKKLAEKRAEEMYKAMSEQYDKDAKAREDKPMVAIYRGDTTIVLNNMSAEMMVEIIKSVIQ